MDAVTTTTPLYLVDGSMYVFRGWFALPASIQDRGGQAANAVHGFVRFLCELLEAAHPERLMVAFDTVPGQTFRHAIYPEYKANRDPPPPELANQFDTCRDFAAALGIKVCIHSGYEADDLIGSALWCARARGLASVIVSADKDFGQLLGAADEQWDFARHRRWGPAGVEDHLGVKPQQVADYLALCGDSIDNIPGVPGIGARSAAALLSHFDDLDALLEHVDEVPFLHLRGAAACARKLREHGAMARLCRRLTRIALDAPVPADMAAYERQEPDWPTVDAMANQLRLGPLTRKHLRAFALQLESPARVP